MKNKIDNFYREKLKNGLTILFEKREIPVVCVSSSIKYGSAYDSLNLKGMAHFIEHLVFKGTKTKNAEEISKEIEKKGGVINAFTSEDATCFWNKIPSKHILTGLKSSSDLILNPIFDSIEMEKERKVILEEIKMYNDNPAYYSQMKILEMLFKKPFSISGTGTAESVKNITRENILKNFNSIYGTDRMILSVVGKADFEDIKDFAKKTFSNKKSFIEKYKVDRINMEKVEVRAGIDQSHFIFAFHSPSAKDKSKLAYEIMINHLAEGMSSVLFREIREKKGLAYAVKGNTNSGKDFGYTEIYAGADKKNLKQIKEIILKEIRNLKNLSQKDFEESKEQLIGLRELEGESSENVMQELIMEEVSGNAQNYYAFEEELNKIKLEKIREISKLKNFSSFSLISN